MRPRRVAIVGCGYVGSALGGALVADGHDVLGTTTSDERHEELSQLGIRPAVARVEDVDRLKTLLADRDTVYLAVAAGGRSRDYRSVYLAGVRNVLQAIGGSRVCHVVYTSSTSVYGQDDGSWVDEDSPTEPLTENGRVLVEAEHTLLDGTRAAGITGTVLRLSGIVGPGRGPANRVVHYAGQVRTDGEGYVNLIHRDDIVAALRRLLDVPYHGVLNLSDDAPVTRRAYYDRLIAEARVPPIEWRAPEQSDGRGKRVRNDRIKTVLGLHLRHPAVGAG